MFMWSNLIPEFVLFVKITELLKDVSEGRSLLQIQCVLWTAFMIVSCRNFLRSSGDYSR